VLVKLAEILRDQLGVNVVTRYRTIRLTSPDLTASPIVYLTGHFDVSLSAAEKSALIAYLRRGGFLFAEACCGRQGFDAGFRKLMSEALPGVSPERIATSHPLFQGRPGFTIEHVKYKDAVRRESPEMAAPELWGWSIDGRLAVVYSPYSIGCAIDGHACFNCRGVEGEDAGKLAANVILYALTH
jgi:hypothetical protein